MGLSQRPPFSWRLQLCYLILTQQITFWYSKTTYYYLKPVVLVFNSYHSTAGAFKARQLTPRPTRLHESEPFKSKLYSRLSAFRQVAKKFVMLALQAAWQMLSALPPKSKGININKRKKYLT